MNSHGRIDRPVGILTAASGAIALLSYFLIAASVNYDFDAFGNPASILTMQHVHVGLVRWGMITDIIGYYLLLLPAIFYLHDWLRERTPWAKTLTFCGMSYVLVGATGAAILAVVWPALMAEHVSATPSQQESIAVSFRMVTDLVYGGMWNLLSILLGGIWWFGVGLWLRSQHKFLGIATIVLGTFTLLDAVGSILELKSLSELGLNVYLVLAPVWAIWYGTLVAKR